MNYIRFAAIGSILIFGLSGLARESSGQDRAAEEHLKMLAERLDLSSDQQAKIKPTLEEMLKTTEELRQNPNLSSQQRDDRIREAHQKAEAKVRPVLNDEQKKKLDELEQESSAATQHP